MSRAEVGWLTLLVLGTCGLACSCRGGQKDGGTARPGGNASFAGSGGTPDGGRTGTAGGETTQGSGGAGAMDPGAGAAGKDASGGASAAGAGGASVAGGPAADGPLVSDFLGVNGFIDDDVAQLAAIGNVREYHNWAWNDGNGAEGYLGYPDQRLEFSLWNGFWDFDRYYEALGAAGAMVFPCIQGSVPYLADAMPPLGAGADEHDPASYRAHASFLFQYAARYGAVAVDASQLRLAEGQVVRSGTGLLRYYENGNEPDADWVRADRSPLVAPEAMAALASADYDGHQGSMGPGFGVKSADPAARLVLAGLAGSGPNDWLTNITDYLDRMRAWANAERGGSFPADVLNVHQYCFGPDPFGTPEPRPALSPEACGLGPLLADVARYRDAQLPDKELWLTEFGYDTHPRSRLRAPAIGDASAEVVQGQWLVRSVLALLSSGIDRAFLYVSRDPCTGTDTECPDNDVQFATAGVLTSGGARAKPAWYFLATLRAWLGSMRWLGAQESGDPAVSIARFYDSVNGRGAYVVWAPTSDGTSVPAYPLAIPPSVTTAKVIKLVDGSTTGEEFAETGIDGSLVLTVTETPTLVVVNETPSSR